MKNIIINTLLLLILTNTTTAQEELTSYKFGFNIYPKITKQIFEDSKKGNGKSSFGIEIGFDFFYNISKKINFKAGISYNFIQLDQIDFSPIFGSNLFLNNGPVQNSDNEIVLRNSWFEDEYKIHYVGIPLELRLKLIGKENFLYTKLGIEALLKINESTTSFLIESMSPRRKLESNPTQNLTSTIFQINFGIGYQLKLNSKQELYIEPQIEYSFNNIFQETSLVNNSKFLNLGIMTGLRF